MNAYRKMTLGIIAATVFSLGFAGSGEAGEPRPEVIGEVDIQAQIDRQVDTENADRQAVQDLLRRSEVRRIAGAAGLDIERAIAAAGLLSGAELENIASSAREIDRGVGGTEKVTLTVTAIIIILLLIIILA